MGSIKINVPLASIEPDGNNPRRDFGDIDALAESIRATGGEPVNPLVVVEDGGTYRVVDGERRLRAMRRLYEDDPQRVVDVLCATDYSDAATIVAMMATDDKRQLTPEEMARGYQIAFKLDVDDERVAGATGRKADEVRRARHSWKLDGDEHPQATFDALLAASEFESADMRDEVLNSEDPSATARKLREKLKNDALSREIRKALEARGCEIREKEPSWDERRELGLRYLALVKDAEGASELEGEGLTASPSWGGQWSAYTTSPAPVSAEQAEMDERKKAAEEHREKYEGAWRELVSFSWDRESKGVTMVDRTAWCAEHPKLYDELAARVVKRRGCMGIPTSLAAVDATWEDLESTPPDAFTIAGRLSDLHSTYGLADWNGQDSQIGCENYLALFDACVADGHAPSDQASELAEHARRALARMELAQVES